MRVGEYCLVPPKTHLSALKTLAAFRNPNKAGLPLLGAVGRGQLDKVTYRICTGLDGLRKNETRQGRGVTTKNARDKACVY